MLEPLYGPFVEFAFMRRALAGVLALSLGGAPIGVFLLLRRLSLTGDAMAHAILPGAAIGFLVSGLSLGAMTIGGLIAGTTVAFLSGFVARRTRQTEDAALAVFYLVSLALGVTIVSAAGTTVDLMHVLFGSVLALDDPTLLMIAGIASLTLVTLAVLIRPLVMDSADPAYLRAIGGNSALTHGIFLVLMVLNLIAGFHALGTLLAIGLMIIPAAAARHWANDITAMLVLAILIALVSGVTGLIASFHLGTPTGPAIVLVTAICYVISLLFGSADGILRHHRGWGADSG
jgi:zinc/manganese transport system permease protein